MKSWFNWKSVIYVFSAFHNFASNDLETAIQRHHSVYFIHPHSRRHLWGFLWVDCRVVCLTSVCISVCGFCRWGRLGLCIIMGTCTTPKGRTYAGVVWTLEIFRRRHVLLWRKRRSITSEYVLRETKSTFNVLPIWSQFCYHLLPTMLFQTRMTRSPFTFIV